MTKGTDKNRLTGSFQFSLESLLTPQAPAQKEVSVKQVASLLQGILDAMGDPAVLVDHSGAILACNRSWQSFLRQWTDSGTASYGEFLDTAFRNGVGDVTVLRDGLDVVRKEAAEDFQHDFQLTFRDGHRHWVRIRATRLECWKNAGVLLVSHQDVTRIHRIEQDFREGYNLFRRVIDSIQEGVFLYDMDGRFILVNTVFAEALGFSVNDMIGKGPFEVFSPELAATVHEQNILVRTTGHTLGFELMHQFPSGEVRKIQVRKGLYYNHRNEPAGILGVARVLATGDTVDETLEKSERHFRALIENSADRVSLLWPDGRIRYASPSSKRILGFDIDELINVDIFQRVHPQDVNALRKMFNELREKPGATMNHQYRALRKDGRWQWMEATFTNLLNDPAVGAVVVNERDISERKEAEAHLRRYADLVKSSHDAIVSANLEGIITSWNPAAERIFGYSQREILGKSLEIFFGENDRPVYERIRANALKGKGTNGVETVMLRKDERQVDVSITISPIFERANRAIGISMFIRDITDRRCLEREILEVSDREKERIGQDLHDDLCQNLIGLSMVSDRIAKELERSGVPQAGEVRRITEWVRTAVDRARQLARGLSLVQLEELGLVESLSRLIQNTETIYRIPCYLECEEAPALRNIDTAKALFRIAQEALHNAVKHSQASRIIISIRNVRDGVVLSVNDDGVGMPENRSTVRDHEETPESGGFGLHGMLYRARSIGATLEFRRNRDGGTTVFCRVPKRRCQ